MARAKDDNHKNCFTSHHRYVYQVSRSLLTSPSSRFVGDSDGDDENFDDFDRQTRTYVQPSAAVSQAQMDSLLDQIEALERQVRRSQRPTPLDDTATRILTNETNPVSKSFSSAQQRIHGGTEHPLIALQGHVKAIEDQGQSIKRVTRHVYCE